MANTLTSYNYDGTVFDFPQYSEVSEAVLQKYSNGEYGDLNPEAASILFALDRFDVGSQVKQHIDDGKIVLANRYVASNAAYQGAKITDRDERVRFYKWLDHLEYSTFNIPKPDLTLILRSAQDTEVEKTYVEVAGLFPNTKLIDCLEDGRLLTSQEIHAKVWELVRRIVLKNSSF